MANLKEIRNRISSIGSTMKITSAMKMVSAAKLKKAQDAIVQMRPYSNKLSELLQNLSATLDMEDGGAFTVQRGDDRVLIVAITSNRGLCGGFNSSIIKEVTRIASSKYAGKNVTVLTIGKKGNDILKKNFDIYRDEGEVFDQLTFENVAPIAHFGGGHQWPQPGQDQPEQRQHQHQADDAGFVPDAEQQVVGVAEFDPALQVGRATPIHDQGRLQAVGDLPELRAVTGKGPDATLEEIFVDLVGGHSERGDLSWIKG